MFQRPNIQPAAEPIINNKQVLAQAVVPEQSANQITGLEIIPWQPVGSAIALHILADFIDFRQRARRVQPEVHTESQGSGSQEMISMGLASEGFYQVHSCRVDRHHSPLRLTKPVPSELVGLCFNCLASSHVKAVCRSLSRCYNCWVEGHRASACRLPPRQGLAAILGSKRARSPSSPRGSTQVLQRRGPAGGHSCGSADTASAETASMGRSTSVPRCCAPLTLPLPPSP
jgi:hypothetical protein